MLEKDSSSEVPAQRKTLAEFEKFARNRIGWRREALFCNDEGDIITIIRSTERSGLRRQRNVLFQIRAKFPERVAPEEQRTEYSYRELQIGPKAVYREGIGNYDSGEYAENGIPTFLAKKEEDERAATEADARLMLQILSSTTKAMMLDTYGRRASKRKEDTIFARHFQIQAKRLIALAERQDKLHILMMGNEDSGKLYIKAANFVKEDYLYTVMDLNDTRTITECYLNGNYIDPENRNNVIFPVLEYALDPKTKRLFHSGKDFWKAHPDGTVLFTKSAKLRAAEEGRWMLGHTAIDSAAIKEDLLPRLISLNQNALLQRDQITGVLWKYIPREGKSQ